MQSSALVYVHQGHTCTGTKVLESYFCLLTPVSCRPSSVIRFSMHPMARINPARADERSAAERTRKGRSS